MKPIYHFNRSKTLLFLISRFALPPGSADVQSTRPSLSTPNMLIFCIAATKATSHAPLLTAKLLKDRAVRGFCAILLSDGRVKGACPFLVSAKYLLSQTPTVESSAVLALEGSVVRCLAVVWAPIKAARSMGEKPLDPTWVVRWVSHIAFL
jgi:hypothetical protein